MPNPTTYRERLEELKAATEQPRHAYDADLALHLIGDLCTLLLDQERERAGGVEGSSPDKSAGGDAPIAATATAPPAVPPLWSTDQMRDLALRVNDSRLNTAPVSVNQVREILRAAGQKVEEQVGGSEEPSWKVLCDSVFLIKRWLIEQQRFAGAADVRQFEIDVLGLRGNGPWSVEVSYAEAVKIVGGSEVKEGSDKPQPETDQAKPPAVPPTPTLAEVEEKLDRLVNSVDLLGRFPTGWLTEELVADESTDYVAARQAVLDLFRRMEAERAEAIDHIALTLGHDKPDATATLERSVIALERAWVTASAELAAIKAGEVEGVVERSAMWRPVGLRWIEVEVPDDWPTGTPVLVRRKGE